MCFNHFISTSITEKTLFAFSTLGKSFLKVQEYLLSWKLIISSGAKNLSDYGLQNSVYFALLMCVYMCMSVISPDEVPATGTGTLIIQLEDVNDNAPIVEEREITVCLIYQMLYSLDVFDHFICR